MKHWIHQRVSAVALIPLSIWFICFITRSGSIIEKLHNPINSILVTLFSMCAIYHSTLGMQVIIEDYISKKCMRIFLIYLMQITSLFTLITLILSLLHIKNL